MNLAITFIAAVVFCNLVALLVTRQSAHAADWAFVALFGSFVIWAIGNVSNNARVKRPWWNVPLSWAYLLIGILVVEVLVGYLISGDAV